MSTSRARSLVRKGEDRGRWRRSRAGIAGRQGHAQSGGKVRGCAGWMAAPSHAAGSRRRNAPARAASRPYRSRVLRAISAWFNFGEARDERPSPIRLTQWGRNCTARGTLTVSDAFANIRVNGTPAKVPNSHQISVGALRDEVENGRRFRLQRRLNVREPGPVDALKPASALVLARSAPMPQWTGAA